MNNWHYSLLILLFMIILVAGIPIGYAATSQTASLESISTVNLSKQPLCIAVNEETNRVYIGVDGSIIVVDGTTKQIMATIPYMDGNLTARPDWIIADTINNQIFVSGFGMYIDVFDGFTNSKTGTINEYGAWDRDEVALDSKRNLLYVTDNAVFLGDYDKIHIYDAKTLQLQDTINIPGSTSPTAIQTLRVAVDTNSNRIYAEWSFNHTVFLIDGATHAILRNKNYTSLFSLADPEMRFNGLTNRLYLTGGKIINGSTLDEISLIDPGFVIDFDPVYPIIYAWQYTSQNGYELRIVDASNHEVFAALGIEAAPNSAINTKTGEIYIAEQLRNKTLVVQGPSLSKPVLVSGLLVPARAEAGNSVGISYGVRNLANYSLNYTPVVKVDGAELTQTQVQLGSRESRTFQFTTNVNGLGNHTVIAEGLSAYLQVQDTIPPSSPVPDDGISGWSNGNTRMFTWNASADSGSGVAGYYCRIDNGPEFLITSTSVPVPPQLDGTHTFYVKAKDNAGNNSTFGSHVFQVDTTPPTATILYPSNGTTSTSATLTFGAGSVTDLSGIASYSWNFGDGANGSGTATTHTYTRSGTFAAILTVADGAGNQATKTVTLTVPESVVPEFSALAFLIVAAVTTLLAVGAKSRIQQKSKPHKIS